MDIHDVLDTLGLAADRIEEVETPAGVAGFALVGATLIFTGGEGVSAENGEMLPLIVHHHGDGDVFKAHACLDNLVRQVRESVASYLEHLYDARPMAI